MKSSSMIDIARIEKIIGGLFSRIPMTPNQWTAASLVFGAVGAIIVVAQKSFAYALAFFIIAFIADYADGAVARFRRNETKLGAYFDGIADRFVEAMIIVSLMFYGVPDFLTDSRILLALLLFMATMTSYSRAYAGHKKLVTDPKRLVAMGGILERFERVFVLLLSMLASLFYGAQIISYAAAALLLLSSLTVLQRIAYSAKEGRK
ncbi:MAG: CDP-alcohol phosphatidyltransferase family protein [Candidatus Aenigmatarchaeota archaeon]